MRGKEFSSFDAAAVVRELKTLIPGSRVSNVYQLGAKTLLFKLHRSDRPVPGLVLEAGRRLHLTTYLAEKPSVPPPFCMALRKHLRNSVLSGVEQHEFERIVIFTFRAKTGDTQLVLELFGDGNIILTDDKGIITQALTYKRMRDRNILRGEQFRFPPPSGRNPAGVDRKTLDEGLKSQSSVEVVRALARFLGIGGLYAEEVLLRAGVDKSKPCGELGEDEVDAVYEALHGLLSQVTTGILEPCVVSDESGVFVDVSPLRLRVREAFGHRLFGSFNEALDEFYVRALAVEKAAPALEVDGLRREAERLGRMVEDQRKAVAEAEGRIQRDRHIGDTIHAHSQELQVLLDRFSAGREWRAVASEIQAEKKAGLGPSLLFDSLDSRSLMINVCVDGLAFSLNPRRNLFQNAAAYYEQGKRARQKLEGAQTALADTQAKLASVEAKMREAQELQRAEPAEVEEEVAKRRVRPKQWFEKFRWFVSSDGFLVVAGKDAVSNEVLIKKHVEEADVVFHADVVGAPFVVVKTEGKKPSEQCLREAGEFAAAFSRGWREGFGSVDVYWVRPEQLSKGGPSGESVGHGAFVVRGERNWLRGTVLRLAVGAVADVDGGVRFVGGPVDAVKAKTGVCVVIVPGDVAGKELFRRILGLLARESSKEVRERILRASVEEVRDFVPFGRGRIAG